MTAVTSSRIQRKDHLKEKTPVPGRKANEPINKHVYMCVSVPVIRTILAGSQGGSGPF